MSLAHSDGDSAEDAGSSTTNSDSGNLPVDGSVADEDALMDYINWDTASADSAGSADNPGKQRTFGRIPWLWFPFVPNSKEKITGFKLVVESNLLVVVTEWVLICFAIDSHIRSV